MALHILRVLFQQLEFGRVDALVVARVVPKPKPKNLEAM
jgi:hypothetical protein